MTKFTKFQIYFIWCKPSLISASSGMPVWTTEVDTVSVYNICIFAHWLFMYRFSYIAVSFSRNSCSRNSDGRFGYKVGQIGPKWDKSGAFSDQISVHLARTEIWSENPRICPIWGQSDPLWSQTYHPWTKQTRWTRQTDRRDRRDRIDRRDRRDRLDRRDRRKIDKTYWQTIRFKDYDWTDCFLV